MHTHGWMDGYESCIGLMIHCVFFWNDPKSHLPVSRACTWAIGTQKAIFLAWEDEIPKIWYRLHRRMLKSNRMYIQQNSNIILNPGSVSSEGS